MNEFVFRVLSITDEYDARHDITWCVDRERDEVEFFANCNDLFWWATADSEPITPENVDEFERAYRDANAVGKFGTIWGAELFCARVRKMRPQGAAYPKDCPEIWPLFDACGPERQTDREAFGNPKPQPVAANGTP